MIKSELVHRIAGQNPHLYVQDVEKILNAILDEIVAGLARGDRVEVRDFGVFEVRHRRARTGRNPKTGVQIAVKKSCVPRFRAGKDMKRRLNSSRA
jgi:integration host factor subunit beta